MHDIGPHYTISHHIGPIRILISCFCKAIRGLYHDLNKKGIESLYKDNNYKGIRWLLHGQALKAEKKTICCMDIIINGYEGYRMDIFIMIKNYLHM